MTNNVNITRFAFHALSVPSGRRFMASNASFAKRAPVLQALRYSSM